MIQRTNRNIHMYLKTGHTHTVYRFHTPRLGNKFGYACFAKTNSRVNGDSLSHACTHIHTHKRLTH